MRSAFSLAALAVAVAVGVACEGKTLPYAGGLMIAVQTDYSVPKDISAVGLYISSDGRPIFGATREVAPTGEVKFPATIAVLADADRPRAVVKIRAVAFKGDGSVRVLRDVITTVPKGRTALLRTPLTWINEGSGTGKRQDLVETSTSSLKPLDVGDDGGVGEDGGTYQPGSDGFTILKSICPDGQTSLQGDCKDATVDADALPEYAEQDVFGGGTANGNGGRCFDVLGCFATPTQVTLDLNTCMGTVPGVQPDDPNLSLAVVLPGAKNGAVNVGECKDGKCFVPLDKEAGWTVEGTNIVLPKAMCRKINEGKALGIAATRACPAKDPATPMCGLASSVAGTSTPGNAILDAGPEGGLDGGDGGLRDDFQKPLAITMEPYLSAVAVDNTYVFIARSSNNPPPAGVRHLLKTEVHAQAVSGPNNVEVYGYSPSTPFASSIALDALPNAVNLGIRSSGSTVVVCQGVTGPCFSSPFYGPRDAVVAAPAGVYAWGDPSDAGPTGGLFAYDYSDPQNPIAHQGPTSGVTTMLLVGNTIYFGMADASITKCTMPCQGTVDPFRAVPPVSASITKLAASDKAPNKLFFIQVPTNASEVDSGGIFEIDTNNAQNQYRHMNVAALGLGLLDAGAGTVPAALAVDKEYVYWSGGFDDPRGGGIKGGLMRSSHTTKNVVQPLLEDTQGTELPSAIAVDDTHVYWTYNRQNNALMFAQKKGF